MKLRYVLRRATAALAATFLIAVCLIVEIFGAIGRVMSGLADATHDVANDAFDAMDAWAERD